MRKNERYTQYVKQRQYCIMQGNIVGEEMEENQVENSVVSEQPAIPAAAPALLTQEQVNKIVAREKSKAAEGARREAEDRYQRDLEQLNQQRMQQEQRNSEVPRDVDANAIYQQVQERFNREMQEQQLKTQMTQVANNYLNKISQGKTAYEDFDEITKDIDPTAYPQLTYLLSGIDNAHDVLYDLSKNPLKLAGIDRIAEKNPRQAQNELLKLSQSINANKQAQAEAHGQNISEPLDRLQPSRISGSNGKMGIKDLRNQPWLKG